MGVTPMLPPGCALDQGEKTVETLVSVLTPSDRLVRKRKKAVRFDFLDLTTPDRRRAACLREIALNRRLSGDVYVGLEDERDVDGRLIDSCIVMHRLPDDRRL